MNVIVIEKRNGVTLGTAETKAIDVRKIVTLKKWSTTKARILYAENYDRKSQADDLWLTTTYATIAALMAALTPKALVLRELEEDGDIVDVIINELFITSTEPSAKRINNVLTYGTMVKYSEGASLQKNMFVFGNIYENLTGDATTTTTTSTTLPVTTTTTTSA